MAGRTLLLLRHAKSSWDDPSLDDFDRPLAKRGREAAPRIGRVMARRGWVPRMALVSPALRTRQTWERVSAQLPRLPEIVFDPTIYEAAPDAVLASIRGVPERIATLAVVGHNPGLEHLALAIAGNDGSNEAQRRLATKYPTGGLAVFDLQRTWRDFDENSCRLVEFITPKDLS